MGPREGENKQIGRDSLTAAPIDEPIAIEQRLHEVREVIGALLETTRMGNKSILDPEVGHSSLLK